MAHAPHYSPRVILPALQAVCIDTQSPTYFSLFAVLLDAYLADV